LAAGSREGAGASRAINGIELKSLNFWKIVSSGCGDETI
jgi:hypothetical protein